MVDLRCPVGPRQLFCRMRQEGETPVVVPGNLMEFHCRHCTAEARRSDSSVKRVLHYFNLAGELMATEVTRFGG